jgi:hypothetical protein
VSGTAFGGIGVRAGTPASASRGCADAKAPPVRSRPWSADELARLDGMPVLYTYAHGRLTVLLPGGKRVSPETLTRQGRSFDPPRVIRGI